MSRTVIAAIVAGVAVVLGGVIFAVSGDGGDERKAAIGDASATQLTIDNLTLDEGTERITPTFGFIVHRYGDLTGKSVVYLDQIDGTAIGNTPQRDGPPTASTDYYKQLTTVTFAPGERDKKVPMYAGPDNDPFLVADSRSEPDETFSAVLAKPTSQALLPYTAYTIADATAITTIVDDDTYLSVGDVRLSERTADVKATFSITRADRAGTSGTPGPASVYWSTANATTGTAATASSDYLAVPATKLDFAAGENAKKVEVTIKGDTTTEPDESFNVTLSSPSHVKIKDGTAVATILNDD